jgi:hypothetical protein
VKVRSGCAAMMFLSTRERSEESAMSPNKSRAGWSLSRVCETRVRNSS